MKQKKDNVKRNQINVVGCVAPNPNIASRQIENEINVTQKNLF